MKKMKFFAALLLAFCLVFGMTVATFAYSYTVTVSGGSNGTVSNGTDSGDELEETIGYKGYWTVDDYTVTPNNKERYYFKGFHISGQDGTPISNIPISTGSIPVEKDMVFVASYGLTGDMVSYTVRYRLQSESGAELYEDQTFYGNAGDDIAIAFRYLEGYLPQNPYITGTLASDETKNVFTFVYDPAPTNEVIVIDEGGGGAPAGPAAPAAPGAGGGAGGGGNQPAGGGEGEEIDDGNTPLGPGGEDETIEDETTPLGPGGESQPEPGPGPEPGKPGSALPWAIGGGAAVVIAAAIGIIVGVKKKKNK